MTATLKGKFELLMGRIGACATSRTVRGSIPGGVTEFFSDIFPFDRTMALGSTQPLVKMSTRNFLGGKGGRCVGLATSPPLSAECHEIWEPKPPGTLWATPGLLRDCFTFNGAYYKGYITAVKRLKLRINHQMHYLIYFPVF
jgi:hypothetical protein